MLLSYVAMLPLDNFVLDCTHIVYDFYLCCNVLIALIRMFPVIRVKLPIRRFYFKCALNSNKNRKMCLSLDIMICLPSAKATDMNHRGRLIEGAGLELAVGLGNTARWFFTKS